MFNTIVQRTDDGDPFNTGWNAALDEVEPEITRLRAECAHVYSEYDLVIAQRDQLLAALTSIARTLAPGSRTFDDLMRDAMLACDRARAAIAAVNRDQQ